MSKNLFQWQHPATIERNNFKFKSLSCWSFNTAVGCAHACRFCYVPEVSTRRMGGPNGALTKAGVADPDAEWGDYVGVRRWDEQAFAASLRKAESTPIADLNADGNRAVMFSTTTDPYQVLPGVHGMRHEQLVRHALNRIWRDSTLNVRILTRSPLARQDFPLMAHFGNRLLFGMSLPTLRNDLARIYEPHAPSPTARLNCLRAAKEAGLNVFVAVAPTYPECDRSDLEATLQAVAELKPVTVFHEPINIRAENVERIEAHAKTIGATVNTKPFKTREAWLAYAWGALRDAEHIGKRLGLPMHLWPDASMGNATNLQLLADELVVLSREEILSGMTQYWNRVSEWP